MTVSSPETPAPHADRSSRFAATFARHPTRAGLGLVVGRRLVFAFVVVAVLAAVPSATAALSHRHTENPVASGATRPSLLPAADHPSAVPASSTASGTASSPPPPQRSSQPPAAPNAPAPTTAAQKAAGTPMTGAAPTIAPAAPAAPVAGRLIVSHQSGKCLTGTEGGDGKPLVLWTCNGSAAQRWQAYGDGTIRAMGLCMDAAWGSTDNLTTIQLAYCRGNPAQQFTLNNSQDLVDRQADKCVDVNGQQTADGTRISLWPCNGQDNQKWSWK
jgi:hypothetical protein